MLNFIKTIYFDLSYIVLNTNYLSDRAIFIIVNIYVAILNITYIIFFRDFVFRKLNIDRAIDINIIKKFFLKCFYYYSEISLLFYMLDLKIDIFIILFRNIYFSIIYNNIKVQITRIEENVIKIEIIASRSKSINVLISRILLNFKNDESSKERKKIIFVLFTRR